MHDSRNPTALHHLADLGRDAGPPRWDWAIARLEPTGRLLLPVEACRALAATSGAEVRGVCHATVLVLTPGGGGRRLTIDARRRLYVPVWVRRGHDTTLVVGTQRANPIVVVASTELLDPIGNQMAGGTP